MTEDELHAEVDRLVLANWYIYTILHAMIDVGIITGQLECQRLDCAMPSREFSTPMGKHERAAVSLDHIEPRHLGGHHQLSNLRPVHRACNWGWRKGVTGSFLTDESRELIRERARQQHAEGRGPDYSNPSRNAKIAAAVRKRYTKS